MINIIHLSDFHLISDTLDLKQDHIINALLNDLKNFVDDNSLLIFSGDLIDKSGVNFENFELRFNFFQEFLLDRLIDMFPILKGRILFVPGNHDFDRSKKDEFTDIPFRNNLISNPNIVNKYIISQRENLDSIKGLVDYKKFEREYHNFFLSESNFEITAFESSFKFTVSSTVIGCTAINSSWLCYDDDNTGKLFVGEQQLVESLKFIGDCDIKIAVMHHPLSFLHKDDASKIKSILYSDYNLVLIGHTHKLETTLQDDLNGNLFFSIGKSISAMTSDHKDYASGYSILRYDNSNTIKVNYRKYIDQHRKFVNNTDVGNDEGERTFEMPKDAELKALEKTRSIIDTIESDRIPQLNEDLILNISQSNKSTLSEIFVEPIIGNLPESNLDEQEDLEYFETKDVVSNTNNILICGSKEVGKTVFLDKIFIELTKNYHKSRRIPIIIKFTDIGTKNFKQLIRDFILKKSSELEEILSITHFDLLIDDLDFTDDYKYQLKELKLFLRNYPKTRLIATLLNSDDKVPFNELSSFSEIVINFDTYYLHLFKSKQIKGLVSNWISNSDLDINQNIEKLIKGFRELGLPKTPLAVTIFLWIINKQQNKPINNAVLVEMFVENLLEKGQIKNIYLDTFDFEDKQRILAFIAKFMLDSNNKNLSYRVKRHKLIEEIEEYLKFKIDISPLTVLDYFLERGILVNCNGNSIRFKTAFFFNYFLARYMSYDQSFKLKVISKRNYLSFINELDFYTGLNRDDVEVFDFVNKELLATYNYINKKVKNDAAIIDTILDSSDTISSRIDLQNLKKKPTEKELEEMYDSQISTTPSKKEIQAKKDIDIINAEENNTSDDDTIEAIEYSKTLKLASLVFKNSTDIDSERRQYSYSNIVISSISFMMMYRDSILLFYKHNKEDITKVIPQTMDFSFFMKVLPIIHQTTMYNWLGSLKSAPIIREKIKLDLDSLNISELEKFLSVYIYADIRGKNHPEFITKFLKQTNRKFILDSSFIKNMSYYYLRSKTEESDQRHLKLLGDIKIKMGETSRQNRGKFIQKLKDDKKDKAED